MKPETKQKSKKVFDVISFTLVFLLFICSLICLIARLNGARFDLFGNRYDVVLTNSMSYKNDEHLDFLKNDNNQFNAFDLAISKPLPAEGLSPDEGGLKKHDIVIYTDRYIGTNMHRIVDIDDKYYERVYFKEATQVTTGEYVGVTLDKVSSQILTNDIRWNTMSFTTFSTLENTDNFNIWILNSFYTPSVTRTTVNGGYLTTYTITKSSTSPGVLKISHKSIYDYSSEIITSVFIKSPDNDSKNINVDMDKLVPSNEEPETFMATFNKQFIYQIRGDAAKDADGWYSYNELQSLVVGNAPGMGYPIRFMGSIWGGIMFALLAFLILIVDIIATRMDKKEAVANAAQNQNAVKTEPQKTVKVSNSVTKPVQSNTTTSEVQVAKSAQTAPAKPLQKTPVMPVKQTTAKPTQSKPTSTQSVPPGKKIVVSPVTGKRILVDDDKPKGDKK